MRSEPGPLALFAALVAVIGFATPAAVVQAGGVLTRCSGGGVPVKRVPIDPAACHALCASRKEER